MADSLFSGNSSNAVDGGGSFPLTDRLRAEGALASIEKDSLYELPAFRAVAGQTLRPGDEALTRHGLELCGLLSAEGEGGVSDCPPLYDRDTEDRCKNRNPPHAVLDVGCGAGATTALLASLGFRVTGVDPSPNLLDEAARAAELLPCAFSPVFLRGRADKLPVKEASQDAVLCECVLSLTPDPDAALAEMARVLRPGGKLLLSDMYVRFPPMPDKKTANNMANNLTDNMEFFPRSGGSCLEGAVPVEELRLQLIRHDFQVLTEEDHSRALAELAARLVLGGGSLSDLASWLGASCVSCRDTSNRDLLRRLGYLLLVARKI